MAIRIGTAGWSVPRDVADRFPAEGTGLSRYAAVFNAVEINSSFYRAHMPKTYVRWRQETPPDFRFSVKLPKALTHEARLVDCAEGLAAFLAQVSGLEEKLGPMLVQLPPSLAFEPKVAGDFFAALRAIHDGPVICEPRHASWFTPGAEALLIAHRVARAAADPSRHPLAGQPGGWPGLRYWRLHGSPRMYYSAYDEATLRSLAQDMATGPGTPTWCVFDNTASGAAAPDGLRLMGLLEASSSAAGPRPRP